MLLIPCKQSPPAERGGFCQTLIVAKRPSRFCVGELSRARLSPSRECLPNKCTDFNLNFMCHRQADATSINCSGIDASVSFESLILSGHKPVRFLRLPTSQTEPSSY
ncbi:hypothetical protein EVAR_18919_1 [Eumeta japonica]|uniref:Uncharacterized protein n=1 Tax=Eumeta variegata TaxID=151549 RepID=A0A4C1V352_EUMVA|nr:hypothetical protein EVAR_18919_1 [Eumeta japonica]